MRKSGTLIGGHDLENVTIWGRDTLTTEDSQWLAMVRTQEGAAVRAVWQSVPRPLSVKQSVSWEDFQKAAAALRPSFIRTIESKNVLIAGPHIVCSLMWTLQVLCSQSAIIRHLIIEAFPGANTDGIDIDSSQGVRISNCYLDTGGDAHSLKLGKDEEGLRINRPTTNITTTKGIVHRGHGAVVRAQ